MKKFISMVMAAAMVVTMVPATAFAASVKADFKLLGAEEITVTEAEDFAKTGVKDNFELQMKLTEAASLGTPTEAFNITVKLENAKVNENFDWVNYNGDLGDVVRAIDNEKVGDVSLAASNPVSADGKTIKLTVTEDATHNFQAGDIAFINLPVNSLVLTKTKVGTVATFKVTGDFGESEVFTALTVVEKGIKVELDDEVVKVAADEDVVLEDIVITPAAGDDFKDVLTKDKDTKKYYITLKLNNGFEFIDNVGAKNIAGEDVGLLVNGKAIDADYFAFDEDELTIEISGHTAGKDEIRLSNIAVWAPEDAKDGEVCTMTVKSLKVDSVKVEVAKIVDMKVVMELVDPDEDVPTFYNGVNVENTGLNVTDDHKALEVKIYETFAGAWSNHKDWTLTLPEGVHVVGLTAVDETTGDLFCDDINDLFETAYQNGDHEYFKFKKGSFNESHDGDDATEAHEISFVMTLVADPDFVGDVTLKLEGAAVDTQEVTIAKVLAPYTVKAEQNDVIIDYRYTEVPTAIVITEAEPNLWDKNLTVSFAVEDMDVIKFEDNAVVSVNEESEMEITAIEKGEKGLGFTVTARSEDEAAVITIDGIELFMQRNIPAGAYSLDVLKNTATEAFEQVQLFAPDCNDEVCDCEVDDAEKFDFDCKTSGHECRVADVADYSTTVHESWINVVTAGRDQDDASFTTKIVVPVGETTMYAGEKAIALEVPAYINANDYVMLPVRAVATALGINNNAVQWDQATKTVIIMYGQRIITMTAGSSVVYVSGTAIPAKSAVEIVDGRAFLGLRDLATTLGIAEINYDATTKTATLN